MIIDMSCLSTQQSNPINTPQLWFATVACVYVIMCVCVSIHYACVHMHTGIMYAQGFSVVVLSVLVVNTSA